MPEFKAVVDIGTNSFHLLIAEVDSGKILRRVHDEKVIMRLGTHSDTPLKNLNKSEINKSVELLEKFHKLAVFYNAEIFAVATSAVRESENKDEFVKAVKDSTGIEVDVIDGSQEAGFIYRGIQSALPVRGKKALCIDIGGGSTEVIIGQDGSSGFVQSYKLGAVRLSKMFFPGFTLSENSIKECNAYIKKILEASEIRKFVKGYEAAVGASGTIQAIASIIAAVKYGAVPKDLNGFSFTEEELLKASKIIFKFPTVEERTEISGMEPGRADILPAGTLILLELFSLLDIQELNISTYALREGYLLSHISE